jgi:hypothetical protein
MAMFLVPSGIGFNIPEGTRNIAISNSIFVSYIKSYGHPLTVVTVAS